jgi:hypothetical protein
MEMDFNPSEMPALRVSTPAKAPAPASDRKASEPPALQGMAQLQRKLSELALTRPEKMAAARSVISEVKYPPDEVLNRIAHLLAMHLDE